MNSHLFSSWGYFSVLLWLAVPVLWAVHFTRRPRRWLCHIALALAVLAFMAAKLNSVLYVNRIQLDQSAALASARAQVEAGRKAAEDARGRGVAQIRFAEDGSADHLDTGGMDEADLKYMEKIRGDAEPEWKKAKKVRSGGAKKDEGVDALVAGEDQAPPAAAAVPAGEPEKKPVLMVEKDKVRADRLDALNLALIRWLMLASLLAVVWDYLRRVNVYGEAYGPLPLPSGLVNMATPLPPVRQRPSPPRRGMAEELAWLIRRGDAFIHFGADPGVPETMSRLPRGLWRADVLRVKADETFIFEALWYNRASFVVESAELAEAMLACLVKRLTERTATRARVKQTVHVVWGRAQPMPAGTKAALARLAAATGWAVLEAGDR